MGRHSGLPSSTQVELDGAQHIGPRRAARLAERAAATNQQVDIAALQEAAIENAGDTSVLTPQGAAFISAPLSPELEEASSEGLVSTFSNKDKKAKRNTGMAAAAAIAAVSVFGASGSVWADSALAGRDSGSNTGNNGTAALTAANGPATFTVKVDGKSQEVTSSAGTLQDALAEKGIKVDSDDEVSAHLGSPVSDGDTVKIDRVGTKSITEKTTDKFTTEKVEDPNLPKGEKEVETEGKNGVSVTTYDITTKNGKEVSRVQTMHVVQSEPVNKVVRVGTAEEETTTSDSSDSDSSSSSDSGSNSAPSVKPSGNPQSIARSMMASYGWGDDQFSCLVPLWNKESGWNPSASNPSSGAYGIPQALPGSKMASAGSDWQTNPATQISWGLGYIESRYGNPCNAWGHSQSVGWY